MLTGYNVSDKVGIANCTVGAKLVIMTVDREVENNLKLPFNLEKQKNRRLRGKKEGLGEKYCFHETLRLHCLLKTQVVSFTIGNH